MVGFSTHLNDERLCSGSYFSKQNCTDHLDATLKFVEENVCNGVERFLFILTDPTCKSICAKCNAHLQTTHLLLTLRSEFCDVNHIHVLTRSALVKCCLKLEQPFLFKTCCLDLLL